MRKKIITAVAVAGLIAIAVIGAFVYRNVSAPQTVVEQTNQTSQSQVAEIIQENPESITLQGSFTDADAVHKGSGTVQAVETPDGPVLKFQDDFSVTSGPDLYVYLSPNNSGDLGEFVSLGRLTANSGSQIYSLPDNYADYERVVIWCRAFSTTFSTAQLQ